MLIRRDDQKKKKNSDRTWKKGRWKRETIPWKQKMDKKKERRFLKFFKQIFDRNK